MASSQSASVVSLTGPNLNLPAKQILNEAINPQRRGSAQPVSKLRIEKTIRALGLDSSRRGIKVKPETKMQKQIDALQARQE